MSNTAHSIDSKTIDDLTRRESLSLSQIRSVIPRHLLKPVAWKSWLTLFRVTTIVAICLYLLSLIELQANMNLVWQIPALIALWMVLYGGALHAAGFFMQRGLRWLGLIFVFLGIICLCLHELGFVPALKENAHWLMGWAFGVNHLVYGLYLKLTTKPTDEE